jgi:hypothetical protein
MALLRQIFPHGLKKLRQFVGVFVLVAFNYEMKTFTRRIQIRRRSNRHEYHVMPCPAIILVDRPSEMFENISA